MLLSQHERLELSGFGVRKMRFNSNDGLGVRKRRFKSNGGSVLEREDLILTTDSMSEKSDLNLTLYMVLLKFASLLSRDFIELFIYLLNSSPPFCVSKNSP